MSFLHRRFSWLPKALPDGLLSVKPISHGISCGRQVHILENIQEIVHTFDFIKSFSQYKWKKWTVEIFKGENIFHTGCFLGENPILSHKQRKDLTWLYQKAKWNGLFPEGLGCVRSFYPPALPWARLV